MEPVVKGMKSFEESDRADRAYYQGPTPHQRLAILWELNSRLQGNRRDATRARVVKVLTRARFDRPAQPGKPDRH